MSKYSSRGYPSSAPNTFSYKAKPVINSPAYAVKVTRLFIVSVLLMSLSACELLSKSNPADEDIVAAPSEPPSEPLPNAKPIKRAATNDVNYAQKTLNAIGYRVGQVDGIWGPRSAQAIRQFEQQYGLPSANGFLSELNLFMLEKVSNTKRVSEPVAPPQPVIRGIAAKLDKSIPLADAPQLVFLEQSQQMLAKPNPFSEQLAELAPGTGIYVISQQEGWYEVESEDKQRGFIKAE